MLGKFAKMSAREAMINIAGKPGYGEQPRWLETVADAVGISARTARSLWRGEISDPEHWAVRAVRREAEIKAARKEVAALAEQYQAIAGGMRAQDENFYRVEIDRLERLARIIGGLDRAGT